MKNKIIGSVLLVCTALLLAGCVTSYFYDAAGGSTDAALANPSVEFSVLGTVSMRVSGVRGVLAKDDTTGVDIGGIKEILLEEAKKKYPNADMVVDILYTRVSTVPSILMGDMAKALGKPSMVFAEGTVIQLK